MALHGCHQGNNTTTISVNPALKAAFNYKVGTYWIYQDSLSGEVDSFFVWLNTDFYSLYYPVGTSNPQKNIEAIGIDVTEYNVSPIFPPDTQSWAYYYTDFEIDLQYNSSAYEGKIVYDAFINYPNDTMLSGEGYGINSISADTGKVINIYNQLIVNGQTFSNVIEVNHFMQFPGYTHHDTFLVAPSTGIIKMKLNHPLDSLNKRRVWELQRYHIVK